MCYRILLVFLLGSYLVPVLPLDAQTPERPNILLVMTDDQGWGDIRAHGNPAVDTPVMDQLARDGAWFERFFVSPVCAPTRASLLTGRYHLRTGTQWVTRGLETMRPEETTLAEIFSDAGYATGLFGKWHNGAHYPATPTGQGFDTFFGFAAGHWNNYFNTTLTYNGTEVPTEGFITDVLTDSALAFIDRHRDRPFFAYVPYNAPHGPFQVPDRYFDTYKARGFDDKTAAVYGMNENVDDNLGRLLAKLDEHDLAARTIVLFLTDNGPNGNRYNGDMRGTKASVHEGGVRVPLFIRWTGQIAPGTHIRPNTAHIDLLPTLADLAGIALAPDLPLDGRSLASLIQGTASSWPDRPLFTHHSRRTDLEPFPGAVRTDQYRLVRTDATWMLFDMDKDPSERVDLAAQHPMLVDSLSQLYRDWFAEVTDGMTYRRPIPIGYAAAPEVTLPATEAYLDGGVTYYGESGWANDWLTQWRNTEDRIAWEVDVVEPGRYAVSVSYTVSASNVGARLRATAAGRSTEGAIATAFDPPFLPSPDRLSRGEVYEKPWAEQALGTLTLPAGQTRLTLHALTIPGEEVGHIQAVHVERVE